MRSAQARPVGISDFALRVLGSAWVFAAGAFAWVVIGFFWWVCTFGVHRKVARVAGRAAQYGAAMLIGGAIGMALLVGLYFLGEWFGCRILERC